MATAEEEYGSDVVESEEEEYASPLEEVVVEEEEEEEEEEESASIDVSQIASFAAGVLLEDASKNDWPSTYINDAFNGTRIETAADAPKEIPHLPTNSAEKGKGPYFCDLCCKTFTNYGSYRRHLRMHYCDKKYTCHLCGRQFFRRYLWVKHQEKIHGNDPSSCRCPHCGDWSQSPDDLREHLRTQHKRTNGCKENWTKDPSLYSPDKNRQMPVAASTVPVVSPPAKKPKKRKRDKKKTDSALSHTHVELRIPEINSSPISIKQEAFVCVDCDYHFITEEDLDEHRAQEHSGKKNTSRYGRRRKQRVLFTSDTYQVGPGPKRTRKSTTEDENELVIDSEPEIKQEPVDEVVEVLAPESEALPDSMLSQLLQQPIPQTMPKNQSHRGNFYCEKCRRFFINRSSYMRHRKMHTGVKPFTCEFCCLSFFRSESLTTHKKKHSKDQVPEFRCYVCGYKAANCASLRNHYYSVCCRDGQNKDEPNKQPGTANGDEDKVIDSKKTASRNVAGFCSLCNRAFFNLSNYQRHAKLHNAMPNAPLPTTYACGICKKSFTNKARYDEHVLEHSKRNTALDVQGKDVPTSLELLKQFGSFDPNDEAFEVKQEPMDDEEQEDDEDMEQDGNSNLNKNVFVCRMCPLAFTDRKTFVAHSKTHKRAESPVAYYCRYCGRPHRAKQEVTEHEQNCYLERRSENKMHHCYNCQVQFDNGSALREHVKAAHLNDRVALTVRKRKVPNGTEVQEAEPTFTVQLDENVDLDNDQEEENQSNYKCGKCNETFSGIQTIFAHFQSAHGVTESSESKSTASSSIRQPVSILNRNRPVNGGNSSSIMKQLLSSPPVKSPVAGYRGDSSPPNKLFSCNLCLKAFDDPRVAEAHEQQAHIMVDWYRCALCDKSGSKKALVRHMSSHMFKVGSVVTTLGEKDSEDSNDEDLSFVERDKKNAAKDRPNRKDSFVSLFCQLCKKVISSLQTLERHRHAAMDSSVTFPYICCKAGCGKSFALKVEAVAHLQTRHRTPSSEGSPPAESERGNWFMDNSWKGLVAGGVGPFSQSLVQLSMAAAENEGGTAMRQPKEGPVIDIYNQDMMSSLASNGELTITKVNDVEQITVEPLVDVVRQLIGSDDGQPEGDDDDVEDDEADDELVMSPMDKDDQQDYLDEGELVIEEAPPIAGSTNGQRLRKEGRTLLKCEDCHSVFTNPCSWKRHRKLHLGIMKHACPHCPRMFYRKDHCDKHVKTHDGTPRKRKSSPINDFIQEH